MTTAKKLQKPNNQPKQKHANKQTGGGKRGRQNKIKFRFLKGRDSRVLMSYLIFVWAMTFSTAPWVLCQACFTGWICCCRACSYTNNCNNIKSRFFSLHCVEIYHLLCFFFIAGCQDLRKIVICGNVT